MNRPWILSVEGRQNHYGTELECKRCSELGSTIAEAIRSACLSAAREASEDAGIRGLCKEGQLELALDTIQALRLESVIEEATRRFVIASKAVSWPD